MLNQVQPAPYDGMYKFPSVPGRRSGDRAADDDVRQLRSDCATNCTICTANRRRHADAAARQVRGRSVVPAGLRTGEGRGQEHPARRRYIAPVTQQFAGFGNIFIMPDQAAVNASYNPNNPLQPTTNNGATPRHEGDTG